MINLLPPKQKEEVYLIEWVNIIFIWEFLLFSFFISFTLVLFLVKIPIEINLTTSKIFLEEKEREAALSKAIKEEVNHLNKDLAELNSFYQSQMNLTEFLEKISNHLPENLYLTSLSLNWLEKEKYWQVSLSGFSSDRESLLSLKRNLENEESFREIYFPPENWLKPTDINFNLIFKLK